MRNIAVRGILIVAAVCGELSAQPAVTAVLNAASFDAAVSPGAWVTIFGNNLAAAPLSASSGSFPTTLGGVSVTAGGSAAPLSYVSPRQVNALIPFETAIPENTVVPLVLTGSNGSSTYNVRLTRMAPGILTENGEGSGRAIILTPELREVTAIAPQDSIVFYATGIGAVNINSGFSDDLAVYVGDELTTIQSVAAVPGFPGIYEVRVSAGWLFTDRLYLIAGSFQSNIVDIPIHPGSNTANVTGSIDGVYPSSDPFFTLPICIGDNQDGPPCSSGQDFSVMLHAGMFSVAFDIVPGARPFSVAAVGEAGGTFITIDPGSGTFGWSITVPDPSERIGNFHDLKVWDYISCSQMSAVCSPFPGNLIPPSRLSPWWVQAVRALPTPNDLPDRGNTLNGIADPNGSFTGSHFVIDAQNNAGLSKFGGLVQAPYGPFAQRVSTFKLYVDGRIVARKDVPYTVVHR